MLTPRQREVAMLVAAGMTNAAIAEQLVLSKGTVANHLASILERLGLASRTELAAWAVEHGLHDRQDPLLSSLQQLLSEPPASARAALTRVANVVAAALRCDKVDVFLHDAQHGTLVAVGTSTTPLGNRQRAAGLDRLPLANGGRAAMVFESGQPHFGGDVKADQHEVVEIQNELKVRSQLIVPLNVGGQRRGVITAHSLRPDFFVARDLLFLEIASQWTAMVLPRFDASERRQDDHWRRAAEDLISVVAHDLRNNLAPIRGRLDLFLRRDERRHVLVTGEQLKQLRQDVDRLGGLVDDLLNAARLEHGMLTLARSPINLVALVWEAARAFAIPDVQTIKVEAPHQLWVLADAARVRQAVDNLLANAVEHAPPQTSVEVTVSSTREPQAKASVTITDRGPGIDPTVLPGIFERFGRSATSTGLGVGLFLAREIARAHGGDVEIVSTSSDGTQMRLVLPLASELEHARGGSPEP